MIGLSLGVRKRRFRGSFSGLLDTYSGAAAAYSLRRLSSAYSGDAIRVRRASDNTETNIGFVNNELDTATLSTFCSGTNGFVTTWYDQSGNGYNATQTTAANQPKIYDSGTGVITENGKAAVQFDGSNDSMATSTAYPTQSYLSNFYLASSTGSDNRVLDTRGTGGIVKGWHNKFSNPSSDITIIDNGVTRLLAGSLTRSGQKLISVLAFGGSGTYINEYANGSLERSVSDGTTRDFNSGNNLYIATNVNGQNTQFFGGNMQEIVLYTSNQSTNRTGIESNINDFYSIY